MSYVFDPNVLIKKLNKRFYKSLWQKSTKVIKIVPYIRHEKQLCIVVTKKKGLIYTANVHYKEVKLPKGHESDNFDLFVRYIMEKDNSFIDDMIQKAKNAIDRGIYDNFLCDKTSQQCQTPTLVEE